jgi:pimeloyl-ACP methyl ester carboxylesterase/heme-degrading monooxygenase HmoA
MAEATFFNVWRTSSRELQSELLESMRAEAPNLQAKSGFLDLTAWRGEEQDHSVIVRGRWESKASFDTAVSNDASALESRSKLASLGAPEPGLFSEAFRFQPIFCEGDDKAANENLGIAAAVLEVNKQTIHYLRAGSGPLMLLVHGYPESSRTWRKVMPELAKHFTVIAPDTRGTGDSSLARGFNIEDVAADLYELVRALGFRDVILVGQDFGVQVVGAYAAQHREDVRAFVAMESPLSGFGLEDLFASFWHFGFLRSPLAEVLISGREQEFFRAFAFGDFVYQKDAFTKDDIDRYIATQTRAGRLAAGLDYYRAVGCSMDFFRETVAPPWTFPVLAIDGDHSMKGVTAQSFARIQPRLKSMLATDCGHFIQEEQPAFLARVLVEFATDLIQR